MCYFDMFLNVLICFNVLCVILNVVVSLAWVFHVVFLFVGFSWVFCGVKKVFCGPGHFKKRLDVDEEKPGQKRGVARVSAGKSKTRHCKSLENLTI